MLKWVGPRGDLAESSGDATKPALAFELERGLAPPVCHALSSSLASRSAQLRAIDSAPRMPLEAMVMRKASAWTRGLHMN
jgi:hypothetical protein